MTDEQVACVVSRKWGGHKGHGACYAGAGKLRIEC